MRFNSVSEFFSALKHNSLITFRMWSTPERYKQYYTTDVLHRILSNLDLHIRNVYTRKLQFTSKWVPYIYSGETEWLDIQGFGTYDMLNLSDWLSQLGISRALSTCISNDNSNCQSSERLETISTVSFRFNSLLGFYSTGVASCRQSIDFTNSSNPVLECEVGRRNGHVIVYSFSEFPF
jgi:hypothetical protein